MKTIGWGVDGYGCRHYLCDDCGQVFGPVDIDDTEHDCKGTHDKKPRQTVTSNAPPGESPVRALPQGIRRLREREVLHG